MHIAFVPEADPITPPMRALVQRRPGSPESVEIAQLTRDAPGAGEVLVEVRAAGVNIIDWYFLRMGLLRKLRGRAAPKRVGRDVAGVVVAVGESVTRFRPGDEVFGVAQGAFAEFTRASEASLATKPKRVTFEQAAGVAVAGLTALQGLRDAGRVTAGARVLVNGASGGIGTFAVQLAKALGAHVTGVCSGRNVELVRSIGADEVIDYEREDFVRGSSRYDLVLDIVASRSWWARTKALTPNGRYVMVGAPPLRGVRLWLVSHVAGRRLVTYVTKTNREDLELLGRLMDEGKVTPVVDRLYRLDQAAEALRYVAAGHTRGKVVISAKS